MIMLMIKIMMINQDKKSEGTIMVISMLLMTMMMMMTMMMQLAICKTDKWEKQNPSGSPPLPNGHKCKSLADCGKDDDDDDEDSPAAKWPQVQVPSYQTFSNCSQIAKSC